MCKDGTKATHVMQATFAPVMIDHVVICSTFVEP